MERNYEIFKKDLLESLLISDWSIEPYFYDCNSFYDVFIRPFKEIDFIQFKKSSEPEFLHYNPEKGHYISGFGQLNKDKKELLTSIVTSSSRHESSKISNLRGNAYLFYRDHDRKKAISNNPSFSIVSNCPTGSENKYPEVIVNQIAYKTYAVFFLSECIEMFDDISNYTFSFGVPNIVFSSGSGVGDFFFFKKTGRELRRINLVDLLNDNSHIKKALGHDLKKTHLKSLNISLFQEDSFLYKFILYQEEYHGYLRERWTSAEGTINLKLKELSDVETSSTVESLK